MVATQNIDKIVKQVPSYSLACYKFIMRTNSKIHTQSWGLQKVGRSAEFKTQYSNCTAIMNYNNFIMCSERTSMHETQKLKITRF